MVLLAVTGTVQGAAGMATARRRASGFTLIELVSVIVILGVIAVIALPRFVNLQDEAERAALEGVAGAAGSAQALNLSAVLAGKGDAEPMEDCRNTSRILQNDLVDEYKFPTEKIEGPVGAPHTCTVKQVSTGNTATFTAYYVSP